MIDNESYQNVLANLKTKFRCMNQVYDLTKEMEKAFENQDRDSLDMVLDMRQKQLEICESMNIKNENIMRLLGDEDHRQLEGLLRTREAYAVPRSPEEEEILSYTKRIRAILIKTRDYDQKIRSRIQQ